MVQGGVIHAEAPMHIFHDTNRVWIFRKKSIILLNIRFIWV